MRKIQQLNKTNLQVIFILLLQLLPLWGNCYDLASAKPVIGNSVAQLPQPTGSTWETQLKQAQDLRDGGKLGEAIAIYRQILAQEPQQKAAQAGLALTLAWDNQLDASIKLYRELIALEPDNLDLLAQIGTVYTWKGDFTQAIATYQQILNVDPNNRVAKLGLAEAFGWNNQFDEAIAIYKQVLATEPDNFDLKLKLAEILSWADRLDTALESYEKIIAEHPPSAKALAGRAQVVFWLGKPIRAIALYKQALQTFPNNPELTVGLARVYHTQQASSKALKLIEPLVKLGNRDANKLLAEIKKSGHPKIQLGFNNLTDSEGLNSQTYTTKFSSAIAPQSQIELELNRTDIAQPLFADDTTNTYNLKLNQTIDSQWKISTGLGITDYNNNLGWYLGTRWQPTDEISLSAEVNRQPLGATIQAIDNDIFFTSYSLGSDFNLDGKTQLGIGISQTIFHPYNRRDGFFAYANRAILVKPFRLELGYLFRNFGYENTPGLGYFSPSRFVQHGALLSLNVPLASNFSLFSKNLIGVQQINEGDRELSLDLTAGFDWRVSSQASFKAQYHHFNISASQGGGGYNADEFSTQLLWQF